MKILITGFNGSLQKNLQFQIHVNALYLLEITSEDYSFHSVSVCMTLLFTYSFPKQC